MDPFISVIVVTYNRAHYIRDALDSIKRQTFKDYEIIVVDDGSTDNTKEATGESVIYIRNMAKFPKRVILQSERLRESGLLPLTRMTCGKKRNCRSRWTIYWHILTVVLYIQHIETLPIFQRISLMSGKKNFCKQLESGVCQAH